MLAYPIILETDADYITVTSPDFPELTTFGDDKDEALTRAVDAFEEAIAARIYDNREIPKPSVGKPVVELPIMTVMKVIAYQSDGESLSVRMTPRQNWAREQELAVLYLKVEIGQNGLTQKHPAVGNLAKAMRRTKASIWMRKANFDSLDESVTGKGLGNAAQLTGDVWKEYQSSPDVTLAKAKIGYSSFVKDAD